MFRWRAEDSFPGVCVGGGGGGGGGGGVQTPKLLSGSVHEDFG